MFHEKIVLKVALIIVILIIEGCASTKENGFSVPSTQITEQEEEETSVSEETGVLDIDTQFSCPDGFAGVPTENPAFCIMICEASITDGGVVSERGMLPSSNVSFYDAQEYCRTMDIEGVSLRLSTMEEWIDAGDGVWGYGGTDYPWGDDFHSGECVLPLNGVPWEDFQVCGFLDTCISDFGVYDQIGNLWEWVDAQMYVDITAWFANQEIQNRSFFVHNGFLHTQSAQVMGIYPFAVGLSASILDIVDGEIWVRISEPFREDLPGVGYLRSGGEIPTAFDFLPISLLWDVERRNARIVVDMTRDREPIPAKVGGAYYSGADARLDTIFWGHVPSFDGSIGFRCVYEVP